MPPWPLGRGPWNFPVCVNLPTHPLPTNPSLGLKTENQVASIQKMDAYTSEQHDYEPCASLSPNDATSSIYEPAVMESPVFGEPVSPDVVHDTTDETCKFDEQQAHPVTLPEGPLELQTQTTNEELAGPSPDAEKMAQNTPHACVRPAKCKSRCGRAKKLAKRILKASWDFYMLGPDWDTKRGDKH